MYVKLLYVYYVTVMLFLIDFSSLEIKRISLEINSSLCGLVFAIIYTS